MKIQLTPTLKLIIAILKQYLKNEWNSKRNQHIPRTFFVNYSLHRIVTKLMSDLMDEELILNFTNICYLIYFITLSIYSKNYMITEKEFSSVSEKVFLRLEEAIQKKHGNGVVRMCYLALKYHSLLHTRLLPILEQKDIRKNPLLYQNQMAVFQIMPLIQFVEKDYEINWNLTDLDVLRDSHLHRCLGKLSENTSRVLCNYIKLINTDLFCKYNIVLKSLNCIRKSNKYFKQETAAINFSTLFYMFHDIVAIAKDDQLLLQKIQKQSDFLFALLISIKNLIEKYDIKWKKCVIESICVVNAALDFLQLALWPTNVSK